MRPLIIFLLFLSTPLLLEAQYNLSGKISDLSGVPFGYCKLILGQDSVNIQTVDGDTLGNYHFANLASGTYQLHIKIPFKSIDTLIVVSGNTTFDLSADDGSYIEDVVIHGKQKIIIRKVDRTIFNPANIPHLVGGNASDVIEFAPGVFINGDNIQLSNGSSAKVMLNDKLIPLTGAQLISFIKSIPTEDIQYIEIIPVAPVKYAASSGGLINIKLIVGAKSKLSKGSVTTDVGQKFYAQQLLTANYAYRKNKFSLYTNLSANNNKYHYYGDKTIEFDSVLWRENYITNNSYKGLNGGLGVNYEISPKTEIGLLCFTNFYEYGTENQSRIENTNNENGLISSIDNTTEDLSRNQKNAVNLNLITRLDSIGKQIDINFDYTNFENNGRIEYLTRSTTNQNDSSAAETNRLLRAANLFSGGIDYVHPMKQFTLNFGGRYSYTTNKYQLSVFNDKLDQGKEDTLKSNDFNYDEHIQALYTSIDWKVKNWSFQVGFRGENTVYFGESPTTGLHITNNYFQLVPKVFVMYSTKKGSSWNLSYSRDFYRPGYDELNPFRYYTSSYQYRVGNPTLKPSIYHSISLSTNVKDIQISLNVDYSVKGAADVTVFDEVTQVQQTTVANLYSSKGLTLFTNYYKSVNKRLSIDFNLILSLTNTKVIQSIAPQNLNALTGFTNLECRYILDKKESLTLRVYGWYTTPYYQQITRQTEFPYTGLSLTKNMLHNRLNMKFSFNDPFRLMKLKSTTRSNQTIVRDNNYFDTQSVFLSLTFRFGNNRMNVNQRTTNATGEGSRVGK
jgi:hypothetical protein